MSVYESNRLNKITGEVAFGPIDSELEGLEGYEFISVPNDYISLEQLKIKKFKEAEKLISNKKYFTTSVGHLSLDTSVGSLSTVLVCLLRAGLPDYTGTLFTTEGESISNLTPEKLNAVYVEVLQKYMQYDQRIRNAKMQMEAVTTIEELEAITLDLSDL